jgi:hypothetical protein
MLEKSNHIQDTGRLGGINFLISIYRQENHSWQGSIQWLDRGVIIHFRSERELLHLIGDVICKDSEEGSSLRSWDDVVDIQAI